MQEFSEKTYSNKVKFFKKVDNVTLIGSGVQIILKTNDVQKLPNFGSDIELSKLFLKLVVNGKRYTSCDYKREKN